jgi:deoxyribodipyrimidine photo-lyase
MEDPLDVKGLIEGEAVPEFLFARWPRADISGIISSKRGLADFPIDHSVRPAGITGGEKEAERRLRGFVEKGLDHYTERRREPELEGTSGLSPYLHFGHISPQEIFLQVTLREEWYFDRLASRANGGKEGWWGMSEGAEAFLDQLVTWRELGFNECFNNPRYERYESLPPWARATLEAHLDDERPYLYDSDVLEKALTHDMLWNAAQNQLVYEGRIHNYLRMLWGKKIIEWSSSPRKALSIMIELNNRYALDGRDPNSYSGIFWTLGRYDRPWVPERPIFGKIRYMSSVNTAKKVSVRGYIEKHRGIIT